VSEANTFGAVGGTVGGTAPQMSLQMSLELSVNGTIREVVCSPWRRLLDVLRVELGLTGTKEGCGEGECGACTVSIDGEVVNSCLVAVGQVVGHEVRTIEGLADGEVLHGIQEALVRLGGTQCGICTPGIALCAARVIDREPDADRARIRELLSGNICRCTGYQLIVDAIAEVAGAAKSTGAKS
jgi:carbon-monoxide dehydrogenase small subunit